MENELGLAFRRYNKTGDIQIFPYKLEECALSSWMDYYFVHTQIKAFPNDMRNLVSQIASRLKHELTSNEHIQNNVPPLQSISFEHDAEQKNKVLNSIFENYAHALSKRIRNLVFAPCKVTLDSEAVFTKYWTCDVISGMIRKNV
ncbi:MAG: hypothetical protein IJK52_04005 [Oscillospiraceae bacterium]|nr:hypothetical protein [Oscillospiraceae bacterium]